MKKFFLVLSVIIVWSLFLLFIGPEKIVNYIGIREGYLLIFLVGAMGGVSSITSFSFYTTIITLVSGGLNPFFAALAATPGLLMSDTLFYYLGHTGRISAKKYVKKYALRVERYIHTLSSWKVTILIFCYVAFSPFPTDLLTLSLAFLDYPFKKIVLPLALGNFIHVLLVSLLVA